MKVNVSLGVPEGAYPLDRGVFYWTLTRPDRL